MSIMEPDLILHPILERAVPSLETLVEVHHLNLHTCCIELTYFL